MIMAVDARDLAVLTHLTYLDPGNSFINDKDLGLDSPWSSKNINNSIGKPLSKILIGYDSSLKRKGDDSDAGRTTGSEWARSVSNARTDPDLKQLTLVDTMGNGTTGSMALTFRDPTTGATYVIFKGTGEGEWEDNLAGTHEMDTDGQREAADYVRRIHEKYPGKLVVAGHSKGGNKAMYSTVATGVVDECYSFDGQGFGQNFLDFYKEEIERYRNRIHAYNLDNDFVSPLMQSIAGDIHYVKGNRIGMDFGKLHSLAAFFDKDMKISETEQGVIGKEIGRFTDHVLNTVSDENMVRLSGYIGVLASLMLSKGMSFTDARAEAERRYPGGTVLLVAALSTYDRLDEFMAAIGRVFGPTGSRTADAAMKALQIAANTYIASGKKNVSVDFYAGSRDVRDFSEETERKLLGIIDDIDGEKWWDATKWDVGYRFENWRGHLTIGNYRNDMQQYWRKQMDIKGTKAEDIKSIFSKAREREKQYAAEVRRQAEAIRDAAGQLDAIL